MGVACGIGNAVLEQRDYPRGAPWLFGADRTSTACVGRYGMLVPHRAALLYAVVLVAILAAGRRAERKEVVEVAGSGAEGDVGIDCFNVT